MATVYVSMGQIGAKSANDIVMAWIGGTCRSETITSSGTTAPGSLAARKGDVAMIRCATAVYATAAATPVATATNGIYCPAGESIKIFMAEGHKIAVIDA